MVNWDFLIDETALASLMPGEFSRFARPICDGLAVFLAGLPPPHQTAILAAQAELPGQATIAERLARLARSCPVLQKLGQILARDQRLSPELRLPLQELESLPPTVPLGTIRAMLDRELGDLSARGLTLRPPALAEASVAVVIPFVDQRTDQGSPSEGVFKILKPGIVERLELELELLDRVGAHLDQRCDELHIPHLDYQESFQQVQAKLQYEVRLDEEQNHLALARTLYADEPRVLIPALFDHCTPRVTAMERVWGVKIPDHQLADAADRRRLARLVVEALIARPIFALHAEALFHSDPHAGNLMLTDDQRLAILDWSLVGVLGERQRIAIVQIMLAVISLDGDRVVAILAGLGERQRVNRQALSAVVEARLRQVRHGQFPGMTWLVDLLDAAVQQARLRVDTNLMLLRKSLHTLEGVIVELGAEGFQIDDVMMAEFLQRLAMEWPQRWWASPDSRQFATRLSNFDLLRTIWGYPATVTRFWTQQALELLGRPVGL